MPLVTVLATGGTIASRSVDSGASSAQDAGGVDLQAAGAVPSGLLRPSQARVLLAAALLGTHRDPATVRKAFRSASG